MYKVFFLHILLIWVLAQTIKTQPQPLINHNKPEREEWLRDAGFGMFIHWSFDSQLGIVISHSVVGASKDYQNRYFHELPKTFAPTRYNPTKIARLAKLAGMKYIVFTAKHHSGFCMWDTKTTDFSIMNTPNGKDVLNEYIQATRNEGLAVGLYFSPEDFHFLYKHNQPIRRRNIEDIPNHILDQYIKLTNNQCRELMVNYGTIDILFFDGGIPVVLEEAKKQCWAINPEVLITRGAIETPEQSIPGIPLNTTWESCITMGTQWQYKPTNETYKPGRRLIEILVETRAKGGALLLNVGPKPDGELPSEQEERLREIAAWYFINHEAIHDVRPWIITNEENIWFTKQKDGNTIYAIITGITNWPRGERKEFVLNSVKATKNTTISVLGQSDERVEYQPHIDATSLFNQQNDGLQISIVKAQRIYNNQTGTDNPLSVKIENIAPALIPPGVKTLDAEFKRDELTATIEILSMGDADELQLGLEYRPYAGFGFELYDTKWKSGTFIKAENTGNYKLNINKLEDQPYQVRAVVKHLKVTMKGNILTIN